MVTAMITETTEMAMEISFCKFSTFQLIQKMFLYQLSPQLLHELHDRRQNLLQHGTRTRRLLMLLNISDFSNKVSAKNYFKTYLNENFDSFQRSHHRRQTHEKRSQICDVSSHVTRRANQKHNCALLLSVRSTCNKTISSMTWTKSP